MIGSSEVKRREQQIAELHGEIGVLKRENIALQKEIEPQKSTIERIKDGPEKRYKAYETRSPTCLN